MKPAPEFNTIIFDYGCVISKPQNRESIARIMNKINIRDADDYKKLYSRFRDDIDSGFINLKEYWLKTLNEIKISLSPEDIDWLVTEDIRSWSDINEEMVGLITELKKKKFNLAILSNMVSETLDYLRKNTSFIPLFDHQFFSCNINMVKPNTDIFKYCLERMKVDGSQCVFIDDAIVNCEAAEKVGIHAIHFSNIDSLKEILFNLIRHRAATI
jgi:putative hydrolase of the HAD superfamily